MSDSAKTDGTADTAAEAAAGKRRTRYGLLLAALPIAAFVVIGVFLFRGLSLDPSDIYSVMIDKPAPAFDLPALPGKANGLSNTDLTHPVQLVNVFASWCVACRVEHPILMELKRNGTVPIYGLNYKDQPTAAINWLQNFGDPYDRIGSDLNGRVGIDFGVYGVPETFIVDGNGVIVRKITGPITPVILQKELLPLIAEMQK
ncbi:MAG: DsbE family thiol:disulfide interchange protein [Minwuia sp.]|nr:DsbE family thiol:disulfide interchange protein [Minwuia sp.]